jgi:hypothetical protein
MGKCAFLEMPCWQKNSNASQHNHFPPSPHKKETNLNQQIVAAFSFFSTICPACNFASQTPERLVLRGLPPFLSAMPLMPYQHQALLNFPLSVKMVVAATKGSKGNNSNRFSGNSTINNEGICWRFLAICELKNR